MKNNLDHYLLKAPGYLPEINLKLVARRQRVYLSCNGVALQHRGRRRKSAHAPQNSCKGSGCWEAEDTNTRLNCLRSPLCHLLMDLFDNFLPVRGVFHCCHLKAKLRSRCWANLSITKKRYSTESKVRETFHQSTHLSFFFAMFLSFIKGALPPPCAYSVDQCEPAVLLSWSWRISIQWNQRDLLRHPNVIVYVVTGSEIDRITWNTGRSVVLTINQTQSME